MIRRHLLAPFRGTVLVTVAAVGLVLGAAQIVAACLVGPYNHLVVATRHLVNLARRLAGRWSGVKIAVPYRPAPSPPLRRDDGWYEHDGTLYRSPIMPRFLRDAAWLAADPASARDWLWLVVNLPIGGVLAGLPGVLVFGGAATALAPPVSLWQRAVALVALVAGLVIGPVLLRVHGRWTALLLGPAEATGWRNSPVRRWYQRHLAAAWHGAAFIGLSFGALGVALWHLVITVMTGGFGLGWSVPAGRGLTNVYRRLAAEWVGVPIDDPYRPQPRRLLAEADGRYRVGRTLFTDRAAAMRHRRFDWVAHDQATWRDLAWALAAPVVSLPLLVPAALVGVGLFGLVWQPLVWPLWGLPTWWFADAWVTPWYMWLAVTAVVPALDPVPAWLSPLFGVVLGTVGLVLARPVAALHARFSRLLLGPTRSARLAQRVAQLTETRTDAVDAQAAELRRIERDLHDGAQSRIIAVGLSLGAVEQLLDRDPQAARELLRQARATSATALADLRDLVRGIHPPVLAERGLGDAVRAVALDTPLSVDVTVDPDIDGAGRLPAPVESAAYFAVIEALANAARHSGAGHVAVAIRHGSGGLRLTVSDDGRGGADPTRGSGLLGIRRRLGTFDGTVDVDSPSGGPTVVTMTVPCPPPGCASAPDTDG